MKWGREQALLQKTDNIKIFLLSKCKINKWVDPVRERCAFGATSVACGDFSLTGLTNATQLRYDGNMEHSEEIFTILKVHHLRLTKTRKALIGIFFLHETPLSARDILRELCEVHRAVNKTTVYRELERLQKIGIIGTVRLGDRKQYYELAAREHHHHLVCLKCEKVENIMLDEKKLKEEAKRAAAVKNFLTLRHSLEFFGLCKMCN